MRAYTILGLLILLAGCSAQPSLPAGPTGPEAAPTVAAVFMAQPTVAIVPPSLAEPPAVARPDSPAAAQSAISEEVIYADALDPSWTLDNSRWVTVSQRQSRFVDRGRSAIEAKLSSTTGELFFAVRPNAGRFYLREQVLGVTFRLSAGADYLEPEDVAVAVLGSNRFRHWVADDTSVQLDGRVTDDNPLFPETRLYYLDMQRALEPESWVEITLWLDDLVYEPSYTYVTGFYLKSERQYLESFYVDEVRLLVASR